MAVAVPQSCRVDGGRTLPVASACHADVLPTIALGMRTGGRLRRRPISFGT